MSSVDEILKEVKTIKGDVEKTLKATVEANVAEAVEKATSDKVAELQAKLNTMEAKFATLNVVKSVGAKSALQESHRKAAAQYKAKEPSIKLWDNYGEYLEIRHEYNKIREASSLTGTGIGIGATIQYLPQFRVQRQRNILRDQANVVFMAPGSQLQFRVKTGNLGVNWGTGTDTGANNTTGAAAWNLNYFPLNFRDDTRTLVFQDIDGIEGNITADYLANVDQSEAEVFMFNDPAVAPATGAAGGQVGTNGPRGLNAYATNGTLAAGATLKGVLSTTGAHSLTTVCQATLATTTSMNADWVDLVKMLSTIPEQYRTQGGFCWIMSRSYEYALRALKDNQGAPIYDRNNTLMAMGLPGTLLGYPVYIAEAMSSGFATTPTATKQFPCYFGQFGSQYIIGDHLPGTLNRYTETAPGFITYWYEKGTTAGIQDPTPFVRLASAF